MTEQTKPLRFANTARFCAVLLLLAAMLVLALILNVNTGSVTIPAGQVLRMTADAIRYGVANLFTGGRFAAALRQVLKGSTESQILFSIRIPRMLLAAILGGALSVSGYLLQIFFRNPIAGPFVLGISGGAKMVVGITLIFLSPMLGAISPMTLVIAAFAGSLLITALVLLFSQKVRNMSMLLVIGIMVSYICGAVTELCITFADDHDVVNLTNWSMGSFSGANWSNVSTSLKICIPCLICAFLLSKPMEAYALGEGYAHSMGIKVKPFRALLILISSFLSACVTALAGPVSFVGIAVPHITRTLLKSSKPAFMIPSTFLCGAVFCVFCDLIARTAFSPTELAIGTVTSVFGAPVVIYMMLRRKSMQEG